MSGQGRRKRTYVRAADFPELSEVLTAAGVAAAFHVDRSTVLHAIVDGRLAAVLVGRIWLVSRRSAHGLWGRGDYKSS